MGNLVKWMAIDPKATYNFVRIYRSTSQFGTYLQIASQNMNDYSYYDAAGTTSHWYRVDFYDSTLALASEQSDPVKGGTYKSYCTPDDCRNISSIAVTDLSDTQIFNLIEYAANQVNSDIQIYFEEEKIFKINDFKTNVVDGTNRTFWTRNYPLGDLNNDQMVDTNDVAVWQYNNDGTRTALDVELIDANKGMISLVAAPPANITELRVTYKKSALSVYDPHPLVRMATAVLACAWGFMKLNVGKAPQWKMGSTQIWRDMKSFNTYYAKYNQLLIEITNRSNMDIVTGTGYPGSSDTGNVTVDSFFISRGN